MSWRAVGDYPRLKLTGYGCAKEVDDVFGACLVDVAYVEEIYPDSILVVADDPAWPKDQVDYDWLCSVITETLRHNGITGVELSFVPGSGDCQSGA
jgi:hypothetical protein